MILPAPETRLCNYEVAHSSSSMERNLGRDFHRQTIQHQATVYSGYASGCINALEIDLQFV